MNENKTHHANAEEIRKGQIKYRTKALKEVLSSHKKDVQDATILELQKDLADLGINHTTLTQS